MRKWRFTFTLMIYLRLLIFLLAMSVASCTITKRYHQRGFSMGGNRSTKIANVQRQKKAWQLSPVDKIIHQGSETRPSFQGEFAKESGFAMSVELSRSPSSDVQQSIKDDQIPLAVQTCRGNQFYLHKAIPRSQSKSSFNLPPSDSLKRDRRMKKMQLLEMRSDWYVDAMKFCIGAIVFFWAIIFGTGGGEPTNNAKITAAFILFIISLLFVPFLVLFALLYLITRVRLSVLKLLTTRTS
jgi:hypothetical protein